MSAYDPNTTGQLLKQVFDDVTIKDTIYPENPLLGMLKKKRTGGESFETVIRYEHSGGRSRTIATALARKRPAKFARYSVPLKKDYNAFSLDRMFMFQTDKSEYAFLEARVEEVKDLLKKLTRSLARGIYRGTGGAKGKVGSINGSTVTLSDIEEIANFAVGDVLVGSDNNGDTATDTLHSGTLEVSNVNRDTGVLTFTTTVAAGIGSLGTNDFLFDDGDFQLSLTGLEAWNPSTAPGSTAFMGVDRSVDTTRLAGSIVSAIGDPITEAIMKGCARLGREQSHPDAVFMSHARQRDLILELGSKVQYTTKDVDDATVGFEGVTVVTPNGKVTCYADHNCPNGRLRIVKMDELELMYCGNDVPELQDEDGSILCREPSADAYEVRASYYANLRVKNPKELCNVLLES